MSEVRIYDEFFHFEGLWRGESVCGIQMWPHPKGGMPVVMMTELPDNHGTSVTNFVEVIATKMAEKLIDLYKPAYPDALINGITWIEHYPDRGHDGYGRVAIPESWDQVFLQWDPVRKRYVHPDWKHLGRKGAEELGF